MRHGGKLLVFDEEDQIGGLEVPKYRKQGFDIHKHEGILLRRFYNLKPLAQRVGFLVAGGRA